MTTWKKCRSFLGSAAAMAVLVASAALVAPTMAQTQPIGGQPAPGAKPFVPDLEEQRIYQRAFEAVVWSQPAVAIYGLKRGLVELGIGDNVINAMSKPLMPRHEFLTANNSTPYIEATSDLRQGPVVLVVPPASAKGVLYGQIVDAWQETINWIPTEGKKPAPFMRIYGGDERFWSRAFTMPDVERVE